MITGALAAAGARVCAIELDGASLAQLRTRFGGEPRVEIVAADATSVRLPEEPTENRRPDRERKIRDYREGLGRKRDGRRVGGDHLDARVAREPPSQLSERDGVQLHRAHASARREERAGDDAASGAEVEHERTRGHARFADEGIGKSPATKCVAAARPRLR